LVSNVPEFGPRPHQLQGIALALVDGAGAAGLFLVGVPAVLQPDDLDAGIADDVDQARNRRDHLLGRRQIDAEMAEIATRRAIAVLHVDDDEGGS
jgi:hypothetical protein